MAKALVVDLSQRQKDELIAIRDHHPKPYLRERAAAILKMAAGQAGYHVARTGLFKDRDPDTVYSWLRRYLGEGVAGLKNRPGRGRKPAFFPSVPDEGGSPGGAVTLTAA